MNAVKNKRILGSALLALISPFIVIAGDEGSPEQASSVSPLSHGPMILHERHGTMTTSTNWSGYAITDPTGSVTDVRGSWVVPAIQGSCPTSQAQYASFWVGIDGYNSSTVEQIGTDSDCQNGSPVYYAWYEFYPHFSYNIPVTINPGNIISANVSYSGGKFTVTITNTSTGQTWFTTQKMANAKRTSAEWIIEAPYSGGVLPLANFGTVDFGQDYTSVTLTCDATIGGSSGSVGSAPFNANLNQITMVAKDGTTVKSLPSGIFDQTSFTDTWKHAGP